MKYFKSFAVAVLTAAIQIEDIRAAGYADGKWGYLQNGADWAFDTVNTQCASTNQSPIDLRTDMHSDPFTKADGGDFKGTYQNMKGATVQNKGLVVQVGFPDYDAVTSLNPNNFFEDQACVDVRGGPKKFSSAQYHFHAKSEHTINGKRYDLEMHTVHLANKETDGRRRLAAAGGGGADGKVDIFASAVGLMFDVDDYDKSITQEEKLVIDKFFDSLNFGKAPPVEDSEHPDQAEFYPDTFAENVDIPYGDLMDIVNFANRWVYTGSLTTPPCNVGVYFQVVERVLPISKTHYDAYVAHQSKYKQKYFNDPVGNQVIAEDAGNQYGKDMLMQTLDVTGNWRVTNMVDNHNVRYMRQDYSFESDQETTTIVLGVLLAVSIIVAIALGFLAVQQSKKAGELKIEGQNNEGGQEEEIEL